MVDNFVNIKNGAIAPVFIGAFAGDGSQITNVTSTTTLQNAFDLSTSPEILTDATRGALSLKRGSTADTDKVLEVLDGASNINFSVLGNGSVSATTYYGDGSNLTGISGGGVTSNVTNATNLYLYNNFI